MDTKKRIILVDDHVVVRTGLKTLIEKLGPYEVVDEFDNGEDFLKCFPGRQDIDLVVLDLSLPGISGDLVMEQLNLKKIKIPVLILTLNSDEDIIVKLFRSGVRGYLPKNCTATTLRSALEEIFLNGYYHNEFLSMSLKNQMIKPPKSEQEQIVKQMNDREKEFLKLVCDEKELTYDQIAVLMGVHHRTVDGYRASIFEKFNIKSKTGLVLFVLKHKLLDYL